MSDIDFQVDDIMGDMPKLGMISSDILVVGIGGAGGNAVDYMHSIGIKGVNFLVCNTDRQALEKSPVERKIQFGEGDGAGNDPQVGEQLARLSTNELRNTFKNLGTKMMFLAAGMGGGTGTGASPVVAEVARELNILTVAIVTMPDPNEGPLRNKQARAWLEKLRERVDSLIVISNKAISDMYGSLSVKQAFDKANDVLALAAKGIAEIITVKSDLVNVDIRDVNKVMRNSGNAIIGVASAEGDGRAKKVLDDALKYPLFGGVNISGAKYVLLNFATSKSDSLTMREVDQARDHVQMLAKRVDENGVEHFTDIIWGTSIKPELGDKLEIVVIAAGFPSEKNREIAESQNNGFATEQTEQPQSEETPATTESAKDSEQKVVDKKAEVATEGTEKAVAPQTNTPQTEKQRGVTSEISMIAPPTSNRYVEVEERKRNPAYIRRHMLLVNTTPTKTTARAREQDSSMESLFGESQSNE